MGKKAGARLTYFVLQRTLLGFIIGIFVGNLYTLVKGLAAYSSAEFPFHGQIYVASLFSVAWFTLAMKLGFVKLNLDRYDAAREIELEEGPARRPPQAPIQVGAAIPEGSAAIRTAAGRGVGAPVSI